MPLVQIRRNPKKISDGAIAKISESLAYSAAKELSCPEGGILKEHEIMFEVDDFGPLDRNSKDLHVRVFAHDYPTRRGEKLENLDRIRKVLGSVTARHLTNKQSWYVWVLLMPTSYGSDTEG